MGDAFRAVRQAFRIFRREPGYALAIVLMLGMGIGANSAIFSAINGVLIQPLPYSHGDRLVRVRQGPIQPAGQPTNLSPLEVIDVAERSATLDGLGEYHTMFFNLLEEGVEPERVQVGVVSWDFFELVGVPPHLGRTFSPEENAIGAEPVLVLGYDYWVRRFGADPGVVGHMVEMNNRPHRVVGVLPQVPTYPNQNDVWMPWYACPFRVQPGWHENRAARNLLTVGRLTENASLTTARAEVTRIARDLQGEFSADYPAGSEVGAELVPLKEELTEGARPTFLVLMAMSGILLLIACANVANLTLARLSRRQQELAVRTALGAGRGRIVGKLLGESLTLAAVGGVVAIGVAALSVELMATFAQGLTPRFGEVRLDGWVVAFTALVSVATGLVVGGLPGLVVERWTGALRESKGSGGPGRQRTRSVLVVGQVTLAFVLLVGSGLMIRSFAGLVAVDPGYEAEDVLTLTVDLDFATYTDAPSRADFFRSLLDRVRARPGVVAAAVASDYPMSGNVAQAQAGVLLDGATAEPGVTPPQSNVRAVSDQYFEALRIPLASGRTFQAIDGPEGEPTAILSQEAAARFFGDESALGRQVSTDGGATWRTVVGVVGDVRQFGFETAPTGEIYLPYPQAGGVRRVIIRATTPLAALGRAVTEDVYAMDRRQPVSFVQTMVEAEEGNLASPRTIAWLLGIFAAVALGTAAAGILSVVAYSVSQRRREFGIRMALGAEKGGVVGLVVRRAAALAGVGLLLGTGLALATGELLTGLLFGLEPDDPVTFIGVAVVLLVATLLAAAAPAWRGSSVDPADALRAEG